jgi:plastocyanin
MLIQLRHRPVAAALAVAVLPLPSQLPGAHHRVKHRRHPASHQHRQGPAHTAAATERRTPAWSVPGQRTGEHLNPRSRVRVHTAGGVTRAVGLVAHVAGDPGATISDFKFTPGGLTIHVGDTVTWTNAGPSSHTATLRNGSFASGVLRKGASASHTFSQAGTFAYYCQIHPFMHGTIVVVAPSTNGAGNTTPTTTPTSTTSTKSTTSTTPHTATSAPSLPMTGLDLGVTGLSAVALVGIGVGIRRLVSEGARGSDE